MKELNNLPPFYVGQKVVYITGLQMPKDSIHAVTDIKRDACGCWIILIGDQRFGTKFIERKPSKLYTCQECGKVDKWIYRGWQAASFRAIEQNKFPLMTFTAIKEKEETQILINN